MSLYAKMLIKNSVFPRKWIVFANVFWLSAASTISQGFIAISLLITARWLGPSGYGQYSASLALTRLTAIFFNLGLDTWLLREGRRNERPLGITIASILGIKFIFGIMWLFLLLLLSCFLDHKIYPVSLLCASAAVTWIEAALSTITQGFNVSLKNHLTLVLAVISSASLFISTLGLAFLQQNEPICFMLLRLLIGFAVAGVGLSWLARASVFVPDYAYVPPILLRSLPFAVSDALLIIYTQIDIILVAILLDSQSAGLYSSASGILRAAFVVPSSVYSVMTPLLSQLASDRNFPLFARAVWRTYFSLFVIGLGLWFGMFLGGPPGVSLILREGFATTGKVLTILSVILLIKSCSYASAAVIIATNQQNWRVVVQGVVAFANIGLNLLFIPRYGVFGAAWVYVISEASLLIGYIIFAMRGYAALKSLKVS